MDHDVGLPNINLMATTVTVIFDLMTALRVWRGYGGVICRALFSYSDYIVQLHKYYGFYSRYDKINVKNVYELLTFNVPR